MSNDRKISIDNQKPEFDITQWADIFEQRNIPVPKNEITFRDLMKSKKFPLIYIANAIKEITKWDNDDLEEECPEKEDKIDKFFQLYQVIFPDNAEAEEAVSAVEAEEIISSEEEETVISSDDEEISETILEDDEETMTLEKAQDFLELYRDSGDGMKKDDDGSIRIKAPVLYENMPVTVNSNFRISCPFENISRNNVFILDYDKKTVIAVGRIVEKETSSLITMEKNNINFDAFRKKTKFNLAVLKTHKGFLTGKIIYKDITIKLREMRETDHVLCIDFGTSNTTAGSYRIKDEYGSVPELVLFADVTKNNQLVSYFPTVVYVENAEDEENISYRFGFEAKAREKAGNYESSASVFYQIKQWLIEDSYYPEMIEVCDIGGNTAVVSKKGIVREYIKNVISRSEDYFGVRFKKLHFTSPVKMKYKFISILKEILPAYDIVQDGIDEAGAIIFDYVSDRFAKWNEDNKNVSPSGSVAVIDCGGGTTDLSTCQYEFIASPKNGDIDKIKLDMQFSNGDFNYGGNNITYRIMQLIKMKIARKYGFISEEELNSVLERSENDILLEADRKGYNEQELYKEYMALYEKCENFIPTQFNNISDIFYDEDISKVKRNFYYLWQFAEQVKFTFYREEKEVKRADWYDVIQTIGDVKLNYLYQKQGDRLIRLENPLRDHLEITITEIRKVIFGDIYNLLNRILNLENGLPKPEYEYYRLSGQSCKINLFNELLKEFIPGKKLRALMEIGIEHMESISLKKHCIEGSIRYMMYKSLNMQADIVSNQTLAERIYSIGLLLPTGEEAPAEDKETKHLIFYPVKTDLDEMTIVVRDFVKIIRKINVSARNIEGVGECSDPGMVIDQLKKCNTSINWEGTCKCLANIDFNGKDGEERFVVAVPAEETAGYGFYVYFIKKIIENSKEKYIISKGDYYNYEATNSGFFDGKR